MKMLKNAVLFLAVGLFVFANQAKAAEYGPAGCGLGHMVMGSEPGFTQILAATTNGTFGNQTFGITTGTLGCDQGPSGEESATLFIETNREVLAKDIARGNGETLASLSSIAGCSDATKVNEKLQQNFSSIFPSESVSNKDVSTKIISLLKDDSALSCKVL